MVSKPSDWSDMHWAIWCQNLNQVKASLAENQCSRILRAEDSLGWTPLHLACVSRRSKCFLDEQLRLREDADVVDLENRSEADLMHPQYAYTYSRYGSHCDPEQVLSFLILMDLLHAGADVKARTHSRLTAVHLASSSGWLDHVKALRYWGASIHDKPELSPALYAIDPVKDYLATKLGPNAWRRVRDDVWLPETLVTTNDIPFTLPGTFDSLEEDATAPSCELCMSISLASLQSVDGYRHATSFFDLESSSTTCSLCSFLFYLLSRFRKPTIEDGETLIVLRSTEGNDRKMAQGLEVQLVSKIDAEFIILERIYVDMFTSNHEASVLNKVQFGQIPCSDTRVEEALSICSRWLQQCEREHNCQDPERRYRSGNLETTPKRFLDVSGCITKGTVQLVSGYMGRGERYVALSHRWVAGSLPGWATTSLNESERTLPRAFDVTQLPATFQDAILLTNRLGIKYLWIDSLCITQDLKHEWERESVKMSEVFGNSTLTLFTDCAMDDNDSFLRERAASSFQRRRGIQVQVAGAEGRFPLHFVEQYSRYARELPAKKPELFQADVLRSHLSTRGWIFQEQAISCRRLFYGSHQMYWMCAQDARAEDGTSLQSSVPRWLGWLPKMIRARQTPDPRNRGYFDIDKTTDWACMLENFTQRSLTKASDSFVAFSGLAQVFADYARLGQYLAGCWRLNINLDLLWVVKGTAAAKCIPTQSSRIESSEALPSWSWAKARGPIEYPYLKDLTSTMFGTQFTVDKDSLKLLARRTRGRFSRIEPSLALTPLVINGVLERGLRIGKRQPIGSEHCNIPPWLRSSKSFVGETIALSDSSSTELLGHMIPDNDTEEITDSMGIALLTAWTSHGLCPCVCQMMKPIDRHFIVLVPCDSVPESRGRRTYKRVGYGWHHCRGLAVSGSQHYENRGMYAEKWTSPREEICLV